MHASGHCRDRWMAGLGARRKRYRGHRGAVAETHHLDASSKVCSATSCYRIDR